MKDAESGARGPARAVGQRCDSPHGTVDIGGGEWRGAPDRRLVGLRDERDQGQTRAVGEGPGGVEARALKDVKRALTRKHRHGRRTSCWEAVLFLPREYESIGRYGQPRGVEVLS